VVRHRTPWVVLWWWLREPDITGVSGELSAFTCADDGVTITDLAAGSVDNIGTCSRTRVQDFRTSFRIRGGFQE